MVGIKQLRKKNKENKVKSQVVEPWGAARERLRDTLPIDQTFTITYSHTGSSKRGKRGGGKPIPVKQNALAEKQSLAAVWSINILLAVIFSLLQWQINTFIAAEDTLITFIPALYSLLRCF